MVGPDLGVADAYATAAFVMGLDAIDWIEADSHYAAYLITHEGTAYWSSRFPRSAAAFD
jgi:thiamine biosynthesis lipoprotein